jgi:fluoride exporter
VAAVRVHTLRVLPVLVGGAAGALARAGAGEALPHAPGAWPWATFGVNLAGTLLLAWLTATFTAPDGADRFWRLLAGTGFCGALTTFSTLQVETLALAREGAAGLAVTYALASLAAGVAAAVLATRIAGRGKHA